LQGISTKVVMSFLHQAINQNSW